MKPPPVLRAVLAAALLVLGQGAALAQAPPKGPPPVTKAPPRLPPNAGEMSRIPAGVDTGSSATSDSLQLGTPVPPSLGADTNEMRTRSAAARAAARPKPGASSPDCVPRNGAATMGKTTPPSKAASVGGAASATTVVRTNQPAC